MGQLATTMQTREPTLKRDTAYQIAQHTYAAILWMLRYFDSHNLMCQAEDRVDILEYHLNRIDALFEEIEVFLSDDPLIKEVRERKPVYRIQPSDIPAHLPPNEMLQQELRSLPNEEVTLPYVR